MNPFPMGTGVKVWLSTGYTDMRCGFPSLALRVQEVLKHDPLSGHLFVFRGRRSDILKIIWHDDLSACLFTRRLEKGRFIWPNMEGGAVAISPAQLSICCPGSTGAIRRKPGVRHGSDSIIALKILSEPDRMAS
ncbi:IS66 family insertion sequence element accessory protein TnpB [Rhizobium sullae]|uniref:Transposase n=1 Tax=Rhizobium sullae TaxID=50338 RepID=A0A4R3PQB1_RHISU|nr:transposase [Rhizobium sullae]